MKKLNQSGFSVLETVLIVIIVAILGFVSYFVWQANQNSSKNLTSTTSSANTANVAPNYDSELKDYQTCTHAGGSSLLLNANVCKYSDGSTVPHPLADAYTKPHFVTIAEWGIQAPYSGSQNITYKLQTDSQTGISSAVFSSKTLSNLSPECAGRGGMLVRYAPADNVGDLGTAKDYFAGTDKNSYKLINNYYYTFVHDQAACGADANTAMKTEAAQQLLNDTVKSFLPKLQAISKS